MPVAGWTFPETRPGIGKHPRSKRRRRQSGQQAPRHMQKHRVATLGLPVSPTSKASSHQLEGPWTSACQALGEVQIPSTCSSVRCKPRRRQYPAPTRPPPAVPSKSCAHQSARHAQRDSSAPTHAGSLLHRKAAQVTDCPAASLMSSQQRTGGPAAAWDAKACERLDFE